jgi:hypothetical protein
MADTFQYVQIQKLKLSGSGVTATDTSITFTSMQFVDGTNVTMSNFGTIGYMTLEPGTSREENISFTGITQNGSGTATITGVTRGLKPYSPYDQDTGLRQAHAGGTIAVVSNSAPFYNKISGKDNDETISGVWTFTDPNIPKMSAYSSPTDDTQFATKKYVDDLALGGTANIDRVTVAGNAGETVAAGNIVYFDLTDNEWKLADASTAATCENVKLGIAQGAGTDGNAISGGVLVEGLDSNQSGLTIGDKQFLSDTAGAISTSAGTVEVSIGIAKSATELYFCPGFDQQLTEDQQDALTGTSGTPSNSNKFVTNNDTTGTGNIIRASKLKFGGSGADGALSVPSGTTNLDAATANILVKNYTSINIAAGATLGLTNKASSGTLLILRCSGNVTIDGTINLSGCGANAGVSGFGIFGSATNNYGTVGAAGSGGTGGTGGSSTNILTYTEKYVTPDQKRLYARYLVVGCGSGGGTGGAGETGGAAGGAGGAGGGALIIECAGAFNFGATGSINLNGNTGSTGATQASGEGGGGGGGGGGAAGMALILYNTLTTNSGAMTAIGGAGGNGGRGGTVSSSDAGGGGGQGGGSYSYSGKAGGNGGNALGNGSNGTNGTKSEGAGGAGGGGDNLGTGGTGGTAGSTDTNHYLVAENLYFI